MDNDNKFCFRLNSFSRNMQHSWRRAQHEGDFYDVILACEDKQIQAHKLILSSSSPILRSILKTDCNAQAIIYLMGIKYKDLNNLVNFMYQGEVNIEQDELQRFISAADELQLEGIFGKDKESTNSELYENLMDTTDKNKQQNMKRPFDFNESNSVNEFLPALNFEKEVMKEFNKNTTEEVKLNKTNSMSQNNMENIVSIIEDNIQNEISPNDGDVQDPDNVAVASEGQVNIQNEASGSQDIVQNKTSVSQDIVQNIPSVGQDNIQNTMTVLTKHQENVVHMNQQKIYSCTKCDKLFNRKANLYDHKLSAHDGIRYSCDLCSHKSKRIDSLRTHKATVHEGVRYPCKQCDHIATRKDALSKHSALIHGEGVCYQCDKCDFKSATTSRLNVHTATKHLKQEKVYHSCGQCDRKFDGKALLTNHIARIHEKVTYACDNCERKFNGKGPLYTHIYATHRNNV